MKKILIAIIILSTACNNINNNKKIKIKFCSKTYNFSLNPFNKKEKKKSKQTSNSSRYISKEKEKEKEINNKIKNALVVYAKNSDDEKIKDSALNQLKILYNQKYDLTKYDIEKYKNSFNKDYYLEICNEYLELNNKSLSIYNDIELCKKYECKKSIKEILQKKNLEIMTLQIKYEKLSKNYKKIHKSNFTDNKKIENNDIKDDKSNNNSNNKNKKNNSESYIKNKWKISKNNPFVFFNLIAKDYKANKAKKKTYKENKRNEHNKGLNKFNRFGGNPYTIYKN